MAAPSSAATATPPVLSHREKHTLELLERLRTHEPQLLFYITRSKNENVVVYAGNVDSHHMLRKNDPVSIYWLDLDPEYVARARAEGRKSDRVELGDLERRLAFDIETRATPHKPGHFGAKLAAYRERTLTLYVDPVTKKARALAHIHVAGTDTPEPAILVRVHVNSSEMLLPPFAKVHHIDFYATSIATGKLLHERVYPYS
jgi:hypothetical protein